MGRRQRGSKGHSQAPTRKYKVFISHATADKWVARVICEKLEAVGISTFRDDRDIAGGDDIPETIQREIRHCNEVVVLLTPQSVGRAWVILEVGMALARKRRINVLLYHVNIDPVPEMLKSKKAYALNDADRYVMEVRDRARELKARRP